MIRELDLLTAGETEALLRSKLGPSRAWHDFLRDCHRGKTSLKGSGLRLMPCCTLKADDRTIGRPMYEPHLVVEFIKEAWALDPSFVGPHKPKLTRVLVDDDCTLPWGFRRAKPMTAAPA
jgi:hypothetical protein